MTQPALDLFRKRGLTMKLESTEGTDSTPAAATDGILLLNGQAGFGMVKQGRPIDRTVFTGNPFVVTNRTGYIEGDVELLPPATPGTDGMPGEIVLLSGGMTKVLDAPNKTTTYNPISEGIVSASAYWYQSGTFFKALGARTSLSSIRIAIDERAQFRVRVEGTTEAFSAAALPTITQSAAVPFTCSDDNSETNITVDGGSDLLVWGKSLSVDLGSTVKTKRYTSHKETGITGRSPTFTLRIAKTDLSDFNPLTVRDDESVFTARMRVWVANPGIYVELGIRGQIENVNKIDNDDDYGWEISGPCIASDAGGDEMYIQFGDDTP